MPDSAKIFVFGEGPTDKAVFEFLKKAFFSQNEGLFQPFVSVGGKGDFRKKIQERVSPDIGAKRSDVFVVVFRDRDAGEQVSSICSSFETTVRNLLSSWGAQPLKQTVWQDVIYKWEGPPDNSSHPKFRFVLHVANNEQLPLPMSLRNHTTDGYVLASGLVDPVLARFAQEVPLKPKTEKSEEEEEESDSKLAPTDLRPLILQEIPEVVEKRGIAFDEDKDFLAAYLAATRFWVKKRTDEKARLVKIILERGKKYAPEDIERVFASWIRAIEEVIP